jgi:hypothetical protein
MGGNTKARGRASKAKKRGEGAAPEPVPQPPRRSKASTARAVAAAAAVSEEAAGAAADEVAKTEEATAAATHAPDRGMLFDKLHTFAKSAKQVIYEDIVYWVASEFSGNLAAVAAAAEGGDARAQFTMCFATSISAEERADWLGRAKGQGCIDALLSSGLTYVQDDCDQQSAKSTAATKVSICVRAMTQNIHYASRINAPESHTAMMVKTCAFASTATRCTVST